MHGPSPPPMPHTKTPTHSGRYFSWWEWLDSNQLRLKPTDLQSAPALQLRRTPNLVNCNHGWIQILVRAAGIEPAFQAWKACILAFVLCPQQIESVVIIYHFSQNASVYCVSHQMGNLVLCSAAPFIYLCLALPKGRTPGLGPAKLQIIRPRIIANGRRSYVDCVNPHTVYHHTGITFGIRII